MNNQLRSIQNEYEKLRHNKSQLSCLMYEKCVNADLAHRILKNLGYTVKDHGNVHVWSNKGFLFGRMDDVIETITDDGVILEFSNNFH